MPIRSCKRQQRLPALFIPSVAPAPASLSQPSLSDRFHTISAPTDREKDRWQQKESVWPTGNAQPMHASRPLLVFCRLLAPLHHRNLDDRLQLSWSPLLSDLLMFQGTNGGSKEKNLDKGKGCHLKSPTIHFPPPTVACRLSVRKSLCTAESARVVSKPFTHRSKQSIRGGTRRKGGPAERPSF